MHSGLLRYGTVSDIDRIVLSFTMKSPAGDHRTEVGSAKHDGSLVTVRKRFWSCIYPVDSRKRMFAFEQRLTVRLCRSGSHATGSVVRSTRAPIIADGAHTQDPIVLKHSLQCLNLSLLTFQLTYRCCDDGRGTAFALQKAARSVGCASPPIQRRQRHAQPDATYCDDNQTC